jgi:hypothetical protein
MSYIFECKFPEKKEITFYLKGQLFGNSVQNLNRLFDVVALKATKLHLISG